MISKHLLAALCACAALTPVSAGVNGVTAAQDSVYLFSYATAQDDGRSGLRFAWSRDGKDWAGIGNGRGYLKCDYSLWGAEKRMLKPELMRGTDGLWHCVWQLHEGGREYGHAASTDLIDWRRQTYFTADDYDAVVKPSWPQPGRTKAVVDGAEREGTVVKAAWNEVERLRRHADYADYKAAQYAETTAQDGTRFAGLQPVNMSLKVRPDDRKAISDRLIGVFFEDINYGADGGLYAELVQNRDFEYAPGENNRADGWGPAYAWRVDGGGASMQISEAKPVSDVNPHYAALSVETPGAALVNTGYDGIVVEKGAKYDFSMFVRIGEASPEAGLSVRRSPAKLKVSLRTKDGTEIASTVVRAASAEWRKIDAVLTAQASADDAVLAVEPAEAGSYCFDMVSLFPRNTFKGRKNGLRADLAQAIADLKPRFVRFPGGCVAHGQGLDNMYWWKNSIGPLERRKPMWNLWGYHQTLGLGFYEYFQFCEDIGADPLPVVAAGVPCQNSACKPGVELGGGQQQGIPMSEMEAYVQDIIDLIDYANADPKTNKWAKMRAEAGHPAPFNLRYIGIGNEDQITDVFAERYAMICNAVRERRPGVTVIGTVGPFYEGSDYEEGWLLADSLKLPVVDEHYYNPPAWFIHNQDFYDRYDRSKTKVYLGEYAAHLPGRPNNIETALAEALYLASVERNGDVVEMTSYAPLLAKEGHTQWNPDLIYFNNNEVKPTVGYYVQQMYGRNTGDAYLPADVTVSSERPDVRMRIASSVVTDGRTGDVIIKLVNMLPVEVSASADLTGVTAGGEAALTVLTGKPDDRTARPTESRISVGQKLDYKMPPYSFSVIRIMKR